ncbi:MAG: hypothetical protein RL660_794 [Bacteroidota bacterium]|jgi:predicted RNA-binding Zn-ribbon protein involved in translation (DUF1610 family)
MSFCNTCGVSILSTDKFCPHCGAANVINNPQAQQQQVQYVQTSSNNRNLLYIGIIAAVAAVAGVFAYMALNKPTPAATPIANAIPVNELPPAAPAAAPTASVNAASPTTTAPATAQAAAAPTSKSTTFERQSLQQTGSTPQEEALSRDELSTISNIMNSYFENDNEHNAKVLDYFSYPINKYYNEKNVSYDRLYDLYSKSVNELSYHKLTPYLGTSTVRKTGNGYSIILKATFDWEKNSGKSGSREQLLQFNLNNAYKITSVYEVK